MKMGDLIINVVISTLTGVTASYFVWWLTFKYFVPRIRFSEGISRTTTDENPSGYRYKIKVENYGARDMIDVEFVVRVSIRGIRPQGLKYIPIIYIPTSTQEYAKAAIIRPAKKTKRRPTFEIMAHECGYFQKLLFPEHIRIKAKECQVTLNDVMDLGEESTLQVFALGYDRFSGARKIFESKLFTKADFFDGEFDRASLKRGDQVIA